MKFCMMLSPCKRFQSILYFVLIHSRHANCKLGLKESRLVHLIMPNKSPFLLAVCKCQLTCHALSCFDLWPYWITPWIICDFPSSYNQPCGRNGISWSREMACTKVVYIALKWPMPRSELPYVAIWKSLEMMLLKIKGGVCAFVCGVVVLCVYGSMRHV